MSEAAELLKALPPCPFCRGQAQTDFIEGVSYIIECYKCEARTGTCDSAEQAIAAWTRRSGTDDPSRPFALVMDRAYDGEGLSLAVFNGENYSFSDGDCFDRDGDTLDGYTAEFLTQHQLEKRLASGGERFRPALRKARRPAPLRLPWPYVR